jgi:hypothetical protein
MTDERIEAAMEKAAEWVQAIIDASAAHEWHRDPTTGEATGELSLNITEPDLRYVLRDLLTEAETVGAGWCCEQCGEEFDEDPGLSHGRSEADGVGDEIEVHCAPVTERRIPKELAGALWAAERQDRDEMLETVALAREKFGQKEPTP